MFIVGGGCEGAPCRCSVESDSGNNKEILRAEGERFWNFVFLYPLKP